MMINRHFRSSCVWSFKGHAFNPEPLIAHPSPPLPPPRQLLSLWPGPGGYLHRLKHRFYLLPQQVKTSMEQSLAPNTSVLQRFSSDKPRRHARAVCSHTESSGGGACVQSAGVGGVLGRKGSAAGWGHSGSVCWMTNERFMVAQHDCLAWIVGWRRTRLVWLPAASWPVSG